MAKSRKKTTGSLILLIVTILGILVTLFFLYKGYNIYKANLKKQKSLEKEVAELKVTNDTITEKQKEIEEKITNLETLDEQIANKKQDIFKLASEVEKKIQNKETKAKIAYITFDDGPYYNTYKVINILKKKQVKATFFTIGSGKTKCYDNSKYDCTKLYKEIVDNGHTIANHTYSHAIFKGLYSSADSFITQVQKQEKLIKDKTGVTTNILRFPGGSSTAGSNKKKQIASKLSSMKYGWVDWTAQDGDGGDLENSTKAWSNLTGSINENIEVILFHDYSTITTSILEKAIDYLEGKGYILLPLFYESVKINK